MAENRIPDNPPAFPTHQIEQVLTEDGYRDRSFSTGGMTLRDYFAAHAMSGWLASYGEHPHPATGDDGGLNSSDMVAMLSYRLADAMLSQRAKADGAK